MQRQSMRRLETGREGHAHIGPAVAIAIDEQGDLADARLGQKHLATGCYRHPTGVIQSFGEDRNVIPGGRDRHLSGFAGHEIGRVGDAFRHEGGRQIARPEMIFLARPLVRGRRRDGHCQQPRRRDPEEDVHRFFSMAALPRSLWLFPKPAWYLERNRGNPRTSLTRRANILA
jgi:hypothetical protein